MFDRNVLEIDLATESEEICERLRTAVTKTLLRRGVVVALSGGIDSSVTCTLAVQALGRRRVFGLLMPERDSSSESVRLGRLLAEKLGIDYVIEDIEPSLRAIGCYQRQQDAIRRVFPDYGERWKSKIALPDDLLDSDRMNVYRIVVEDPDGNRQSERLPLQAYLELIAATNFKQRIRKTLEYYHADRLNFAVAGTPNRLEYDQGFFVKNGDGAADVKPLAHLYKSQVYALARHFGLPAEICDSQPTTDTYSLSQSQDEFYFVLPYGEMDLLLWAKNHDVPHTEAAQVMDLKPEQVARVYHDIDRKRTTTRPLQLAPILLKEVPEIDK